MSASNFQVFVNDSNGSDPYTISSSDMIAELMYKIEDRTGLPPNKQNILFSHSLLNAGKMISYYNITAGSNLYLVDGLPGAGMEPSLIILAKNTNQKRKICRVCYARNSINATNCRKRKCGHSTKLRLKKSPKD
ncbi:hypothetical protein GJ496_009543 [Pomphorhynchus laevis]|nr:hypothetical protein GJ496_009542 [Pomphorhynchus laevis]KAI0988560.1 hypothetical protein GJ496_009543 [Pomphorhynchus laevis]